MDNHYDFENAGLALGEIAEECEENDTGQLATINDFNSFKIVSNVSPTYYSFSMADEDASECQEVVFTIQGIISKKDLPPIVTRQDKRNQGFMKQGIQLTGVNGSNFDTCIENLKRLNRILARQVPEGALDAYVPGNILNYSTIDVGTRYFTSRKDDPTGALIAFDRSVDPRGILTAMNDSSYFHGQDNEVLYYSASTVGNDRQRRFVKAEPATFRVGDIVEVQLTVSAIPVRRNRFKMIVQLRAIALLDREFTERATLSRAKYLIRPSVPSTAIKRKVGYETIDNELTGAREKMVKLTMDSNTMNTT